MERILVGVDRPTREKVPSGTLCGFRARLHQLGEMLIPKAAKSSNSVRSSGESTNFRSPARARRPFYAALADGQLSSVRVDTIGAAQTLRPTQSPRLTFR